MILTIRREHGSTDAAQSVVIFGSGLIGRSILGALAKRGQTENTLLPLSWTERKARTPQLDAMGSRLRELPAGATIDVIWAAGRAGFTASQGETAQEREAFTDVMEWLRGLSQQLSGRALTLHVVSSAGGLYEGQRFVDADSVPRPLRPYGDLKLAQEGIARTLCDTIPLNVYRPSTVYGTHGQKERSGLVNTLIMNAKTHTVSRIFGGLDTIRDYVLAGDVGKFIAAQTGRPITQSLTFLLASGKPAALGEILSLIERILGRPLLIGLDPVPSNARHITFRPSALPVGWHSTDIETGIRQVMRQLSATYEAAIRL